MPAGTVSQTTLGERGFQVTVSRRVLAADGKVLREDSFPSRYIPEDAIYLIGKGGKLPAGQTLSGLYPGYTGPTAAVDLATWLAKPAKKKKKPVADANPTGGATDPPEWHRHRREWRSGGNRHDDAGHHGRDDRADDDRACGVGAPPATSST